MQSVGNTDPFSSLGGAFSLASTTTTQEPLYATVDKSKKTNANQGPTDMFAMFDTTPAVPPANNGGGAADLLGSAFSSSNTSSAAASNQVY